MSNLEEIYEKLDILRRKREERKAISNIIEKGIEVEHGLSVCLHLPVDYQTDLPSLFFSGKSNFEINIDTNRDDFIAIAQILLSQLNIEIGQLISELEGQQIQIQPKR